MSLSNKLTLILDSTQIASFMQCPRMWHYEHDLSVTPHHGEEKDAMTMGTYMHRLLEVYYKQQAMGQSKSVASAKAHAYPIDADYIGQFHKGCNGKILSGELTNSCDHCFKQNIDEEEILTRTEGLPLDAPKRKEVLDRFQMYTFTYAANDFQIASPEQAEVGFSYHLAERADRIYILEGKADLYNATLGGQTLGYVDHKSQLRRRDIYEKSIQFRNYGLVTNASIAMVNYIRFAKKIDADTFVRKAIPFQAGEHAWWKEQVIAVFDRVADALAQGSDDPTYWMDQRSNPNWAMCSGLFGYPCNYTPLCSIKNPQLVQLTLENSFVKKDLWRPW